MSTDEFLKGLNYGQLQYARRRCDELIQAKNKEAKRKVWVVSDTDIKYKYFQEDEYVCAAEFLLSLARKNAEEGDIEDLELSSEFLMKSEWDEMFPNNERGGV
ncbi:hypothetical protein CJ010_00755 [Azoarcus sp. DD4]|uniref:hypothetical protein n=1 Tax=Azoarcus sp. DD4 TaxID=2027405 RepID=UPI00112CA209|nr:hypothetical protein [Azoarcus sp. DD4]QDF95183.1 hypothetical protein CJ010_00755 [Azoarcus sp. DD4]